MNTIKFHREYKKICFIIQDNTPKNFNLKCFIILLFGLC